MAKQYLTPKRIKSKRTKIIATLGPASSTPARIKSLLTRGVDVFRVNLSHGDHQTHTQTVNHVRQVAKEMKLHIAILMDLCGPKIRTGIFENGSIELKDKQKVVVTTEEVVGKEGLIPSQYPNLHKDMRVGQRILLDDGKMELRVDRKRGQELFCSVIYGGILNDKKGMNLPDTSVSSPALTLKDKQDIQLAIELKADFVALSFVRTAKDVQDLHDHLAEFEYPIPVIAKIERPEAVDNIDDILNTSFGIMIARGDLGIELDAEKIPLIQNSLIEKARCVHKPVIVATQMMESMIENSRPTRAEISDVANAAMRSADAVMLSGETSVGKYPLQAVEYMNKTLCEIEQNYWEKGHSAKMPAHQHEQEGMALREGMSRAALGLAHDLGIRAIVVPTSTGMTSRYIASHRPPSIVFGVSESSKICRRMSLYWGVVSLKIKHESFKSWNKLTEAIRMDYNLIQNCDRVLVVSGFSNDEAKSEPVIKMITIADNNNPLN